MQAFHNADKKYYDEGVKILEFLKNAYGKYLSQNNKEKGRMLKFLLSNCTIKDKKVSYDYTLPFAYFVNFDSCQEKYLVCDSPAAALRRHYKFCSTVGQAFAIFCIKNTSDAIRQPQLCGGIINSVRP
ncbi:MAG: hypothetical protein PHX18_01840 [Candidatus Gastranaerophilales bacterium]|nr:hypothetical protein [Candidatus Gastranaerophilales bacterium]